MRMSEFFLVFTCFIAHKQFLDIRRLNLLTKRSISARKVLILFPEVSLICEFLDLVVEYYELIVDNVIVRKQSSGSHNSSYSNAI